uniref:DUF3395 domain-containing protein n=1 Tax=Macrostomum lignano TaxID=282301 RepID=A0A1I8GAP2_9PLAT
ISRPQLATTAASAMLLCSLLSRLSFSTAAGRRSLCTAFRSHRFETQAPADKQTVDDIDVDGYDLSLSGEVNGDMPTGRMQQRILTGELLHHSRDGVAKKLGGSAGPTGDYEASYHVRLPRVREYELPRTVASDFLRFNTVVYPPQIGEDSDEERRPAETCVEVGKIAIDRKALLLFCIAVQACLPHLAPCGRRCTSLQAVNQTGSAGGEVTNVLKANRQRGSTGGEEK